MKTLKHFCNGLLLGALFASNAVAMDDVAVVPTFDGVNSVDTSSLAPAIGQFGDSSRIDIPPSVDFQNFDKKEKNQSVEQLSGPWDMSTYCSRGLIKAVDSDHECKVYVNRAGDSTVVSHNGTIFTLNPEANKLFIYSMSDNGWQLTQEIENALTFRLYEKQNILVVAIKGEIKRKNEKNRPSVKRKGKNKRKDKDKKKDKNEKPRPFLRIYERTNSGWEKKSNIQFKLNCWNDDYIDISSHFSVAQDGKTFFVTRYINEKQQSTLSIYKKVDNDWLLKQEINDVDNYFCHDEGMLFVRNNYSSYFYLKRNKKQVALLEEMNDGSWKVKLTFFSSDSLGIEKPVVSPDKNKFFLDKRLFCKNQQGVWKDAKVTFSTKKNETFRSFVFLSNEEFLVWLDHSDVLDLFPEDKNSKDKNSKDKNSDELDLVLKFKHKNPTWVSSESWILNGEFILPGELQNNLFIRGHSDQADVFLRPYRKKGSFEGDDLIICNRLNEFQVIKWVFDFHVMHGGKFILVVSSGEKGIRLYEKDENGKYCYKNTCFNFTNFHRVNVYHQEFFAICSTEGSYDLYQLTEDGKVIEKLHSTHLSNIFVGENKEMLFIQTKPCDEEYIQNIFGVEQDMPVEWGMTGQKRGPAHKNEQLQGKRQRT